MAEETSITELAWDGAPCTAVGCILLSYLKFPPPIPSPPSVLPVRLLFGCLYFVWPSQRMALLSKAVDSGKKDRFEEGPAPALLLNGHGTLD